MFKNLSAREKRLALVTLVVALSTLCYRFVFLPQLENLWALEDKTAELKLQVIEMERDLAQGDRIERLYREFEAAISQKGTDLQESTAFLRTLADITKRNDMTVIRQEQPPIQPSRYYKIFSARLSVKTRPISLARFLRDLQRGKELIRVENVEIKALDNDQNLSVNMKLTKVVAAERDV